MLNFVAKVYRGGMDVLLNVIFFGCGCGGFFVILDRDWSNTSTAYMLLSLLGGTVGGLLVGIIINIVVGGFVANFLNMVDNTEKIEHYLSKMKNTSDWNSSEINLNIGENKEQYFSINTLGKYKAKGIIDVKDAQDINSNYLFQIKTNEIFEVIGTGHMIDEKYNWCFVKNNEGVKGWCSSENLEII